MKICTQIRLIFNNKLVLIYLNQYFLDHFSFHNFWRLCIGYKIKTYRISGFVGINVVRPGDSPSLARY